MLLLMLTRPDLPYPWFCVQEAGKTTPNSNHVCFCRRSFLWEADLYTPPALGGAALLTIQRQRCIKMLCPKDPEFYTPLALNCQKGQHLPALEVYENQSPIKRKKKEKQKKDKEKPKEKRKQGNPERKEGKERKGRTLSAEKKKKNSVVD